MNILLYNNFHIGDLLFNQPIIKNLCKNNPNYTFKLYCNYNTYIFKDIPNFEVIASGIFPAPHSAFFSIINENTIAINLWIAALASNYPITNFKLNDIECNIHNYTIAFKRILGFIKDRYNISINLEDYNENIHLPIIPDTDISEFIDWNSKRKDLKKLVFYYNYTPKSGQTVAIDDHNTFIVDIAKVFVDCIFIIPNFTPEIEENITKSSITNIISCEKDFNCKQNSITCEHLCKIQKIIEHCDYSIHFDIGACMYYINNNIDLSKNIPIHISVSDVYPTRLMCNSDKIKNKMKLIISTNIVNTYLQLENILK
jgi:hypothetical protein